jgi:hypothetical protein
MKIAVLICGEYREFERAHMSWNFSQLGEVDYYFSTWDTTTSTNTKTAKAGLSGVESVTLDRICKHITLVDADIESKSKLSNLSIMTNSYCEKVAYPCAHMIDRWHAGIRMLSKSQIEYDAVIIIRPDLFVRYDQSKSLLDFLSGLQPKCIYGHIGENIDVVEKQWMQDVILIGKHNEIIKLAEVPVDIQYNDQKETNIHYLLAGKFAQLYDKILNITPLLAMTIVRENSRHLINPDFDEMREHCLVWDRDCKPNIP